MKARGAGGCPLSRPPLPGFLVLAACGGGSQVSSSTTGTPSPTASGLKTASFTASPLPAQTSIVAAATDLAIPGSTR